MIYLEKQKMKPLWLCTYIHKSSFVKNKININEKNNINLSYVYYDTG